MSLVIKDGKPKAVKDLRWLLRRSYGLARPDGLELANTFAVLEIERGGLRPDCFLIARFKDGATYVTTFMSKGILHAWLDRYTFSGYPIKWVGADGQTKLYCDIGSDSYRSFNPYQ